MASNIINNDVDNHVEWKSCKTGKYPCDPHIKHEDAWARQFTNFPIEQPSDLILQDQYSYQQIKKNPGGIGLMPAGTVIKTTDGVTKLNE